MSSTSHHYTRYNRYTVTNYVKGSGNENKTTKPPESAGFSTSIPLVRLVWNIIV